MRLSPNDKPLSSLGVCPRLVGEPLCMSQRERAASLGDVSVRASLWAWRNKREYGLGHSCRVCY